MPIAQLNIALMKGDNIDDPLMIDFVNNIDSLNEAAESSPGFIWRLKDEDGCATSFNPFNDDQLIINLSVWESHEALKQYVIGTVHKSIMRRKEEWFVHFGKPYFVMWHVPEGHVPTLEEAKTKLTQLQTEGPSEEVFGWGGARPQA